MGKAMKEFCLRHELLPDADAIMAGIDKFAAEIKLGLNEPNGLSSLKALPSYISPVSDINTDESVIVMDAGGTNLRVALVKFSGGVPSMEYFENHQMPGTSGALSPQEFFDRLAASLAPVADKASRIGICFSFPAEILPSRDARIINFTKEVKAPGAEGMLVWEGIRDALKRQGLPHDKNAAVLNDTVAALLGAVTGCGGRAFDSYIGLILGTGTNCCYIEQNENIKKAPALASIAGKTIVNLESGGYAKAPRTDIDVLFDAKTDIPGSQMFEKMVSGAYQGGLFFEYLKAAALEGCFSPEFRDSLHGLDGNSITGKHIDEFCAFPYGNGLLAGLTGGRESDIEALFMLVDAFFDRAARLVTMSLTGILHHMGAGKKPYLPVCISAEGTTFYKARLLRPKLDYYMETFARQKFGYNYEFVKAENATLFGTATAGLFSPA